MFNFDNMNNPFIRHKKNNSWVKETPILVNIDIYSRWRIHVIRLNGTEYTNNQDSTINIIIVFQECNDVEPGTVVEVTKIGYKLHNRCIRPALVGVSRS